MSRHKFDDVEKWKWLEKRARKDTGTITCDDQRTVRSFEYGLVFCLVLARHVRGCLINRNPTGLNSKKAQ